MQLKFKQLLLILAALPISGLALAHTAPMHTEQGLLAGLLHPLAGADHLLVLLALGLWSATVPGAAGWRTLAVFVPCLLGGALLGMAVAPLPGLESALAATLLLAGLLLVTLARLPVFAALVLTGLFALVHGSAHGAEIPAAVSPLAYVPGFLLSSVAVLAGAVAIGRCVYRFSGNGLLRAGGLAAGGFGAWLLLGAG